MNGERVKTAGINGVIMFKVDRKGRPGKLFWMNTAVDRVVFTVPKKGAVCVVDRQGDERKPVQIGKPVFAGRRRVTIFYGEPTIDE